MDEIKNIAPKLLEHDKKNCFVTPDGYFDSLLPRVQEMIAKREVNRLEQSFFVRYRAVLLYSLTFLIILAAALTIFIRTPHHSQTALQTDSSSFEYSDFELDEQTVYAAYSDFASDTCHGLSDTICRYNREVIDYLVYEDIDDEIIFDNENL